MLSFQKYLAEALHIPDTDWGYWITDQGKWLVVGNHEHGYVARTYSPHIYADPKKVVSSWQEPHIDGWVRIVGKLDSEEIINISLHSNVSFKALSALKQFVRECISDEFYVTNLDHTDQRDPDWMNKSKTLAYLNTFKPKVARNLHESQIPPSQYGYWITDAGTFLPVDQNHGDVALKSGLLIGDISSRQGPYVAAENQGWVRVISGRNMEFQFKPNALTFRSWSSMKKFVMAMGAFSHEFFLDNNTRHPLTFHNPVEVMTYLQKIKPKVARNLHEGKLPEYDAYGYWLTGQGEFIPVRYQEHAQEAAEHLGRAPSTAYAFALTKGWFRIAGSLNSPTMNIEYDSEPKRSVKTKVALRDFIKHSQASRYFINNLGFGGNRSKSEALKIINKDLK